MVTEEWTMRCRVCGSNNEDGSKFCWNCGNKLTEQSETRSSSVNQPGIQQNSGDVQHNQVGTPPKQVRMPQRQKKVSSQERIILCLIILRIPDSMNILDLHRKK